MKNEKDLFRWVFGYVKKYIGLFVAHLMVMPAQYLTKMLASAVGFAAMLDGLINLDLKIFLGGIAIYIVGIVISSVLSGTDVFVNGKLECNLKHQIKRELLRAILSQDQQNNAASQIHSGQFIDICTTDVEKVASFPGTQFGNFFTPIVVSFISIILLSVKSKVIAVVTLVSMAISLSLNLYFIPKYRKTNENTREKESEFVTAFEEEILGGPVLRIFSMQEKFSSKMRYIAQRVLHAQRKETKVRLHHGLFINLLAFSSLTVPFLVGAFQVMFGTMEVSSLMYVTQISGNLLWFMDSLAQAIMNMQKVIVSGNRIRETLGEEIQDQKEETEPIKTENINTAIQIKDLSVCFGEKKVLDHVSLEIPKGCYAAFVGESGSGKSTILKSIDQLVPYSGTVSIFNREIHSEDKKALRAVVSYVTQDSEVINDSIYENILLGDLSADRKAVECASQAAGVDRFVDRLPEKYYTMIEEQGNNFSGGERQRIALARAFLKHAPIVLLDEITSALDSTTEKEILQQIEMLRGNATIVVVAQKLHTIEHADRIHVVKGGKIVEIGTHEELLQKHGEYARLLELEKERAINDNKTTDL